MIFTSGSTGAPKGVAVSHRSAAAFVDAEARLWNVEREDRVLAGLSVGFDASCEEMWLAWRHGAALVPAPRSIVRAGSELGPWLAGRGVTVVSTVPTLAAMWDDETLAGVRLLILGGEACPEPLAWRLADGRAVWNTYGPTEATVVSTASRIRTGEPVTIGWPLDGWETAVVDDDGEPVLDIERVEPCDPTFAASICTPAETVEWWSLSNPHEYFIALWSSKEALAKALGNAPDYDPRRLQAPMLWPEGRAGVWQAADLPVTDDHVAWVCWRSSSK